MKNTIPFATAAVLVLTFAGASSAPGVDFEKDILPIFKENCFKCHGDGKAKAGVRLDADRMENAMGDIIVPGDLEKSEVYTSMIAEDGDDRMPPPGKGRTMSKEEIEKVKEWILAGAPPFGEITAKEGEGGATGFAPRKQPITTDFTNSEGRTITATLLRVHDDTAVLRLATGKIYNYPIEKLSDESQKIVRDFESSEQDPKED